MGRRKTVTDLVSTKTATEILGVGPTTVKRWADGGLLPVVRTVGGHRRYRRSDIRRLLSHRGSRSHDSIAITMWLSWMRVEDIEFLRLRISELGAAHGGDWFAASDYLDAVLERLVEHRAGGRLSDAEEQLASTKLTQALAALTCESVVHAEAPRGILAAASGERNPSGPALAQLCLRSAGIDTAYFDDHLPFADLVDYIRTVEPAPRIVVMMASKWHDDPAMLERTCSVMSTDCRRRGIELVIGGRGPWPERLAYGTRCRSFTELRTALP